MYSSVDSSRISTQLSQPGHSVWQRGDMVLEVDPPDCAHRDGLPEAPLSGTNINGAARAIQESQGQDQGPEARSHDGESSSAQTNPTCVVRGLTTVRKWFTVKGKRYHDTRNSLLLIEMLDQYPNGYPRLAAYINSDVNFAMYRKFGTLRNRVLLHRQDELNKLEKRLNEIDIRDDVERNTRIRSIRYDREKDSQRTDLIDEIDAKLKHYDEMLLRAQRLQSIGPPTKRNHRSLFNWIWNKQPLVESERDFIFRQDDFVTLADGQDNSWLEARVEDFVNRFPLKGLQTILASSDQLAKTKDKHIHYFSKQRLGILVKLIVILVTVAFLMIPVCLLFQLNTTDKVKVIIVLVFVLAFPGAIAAFTQARSYEVFAATAAYCAVLVVFLGNLASNGGSRP